MILLYRFDRDKNRDDNSFDELRLIQYKNGMLIFDFNIIKREYLYYEAIQELIIGKVILLKKNKNIDKEIKIEDLIKMQRNINVFQKLYLLLIFKSLFENCDVKPSNYDKESCTRNFDKLVNSLLGEDMEESIKFSNVEVDNLKTYFKEIKTQKLSYDLGIFWSKIINKSDTLDDLVIKLTERYKDFISEMTKLGSKKRRKCLLIGKKKNEFYMAVSGTDDYDKEKPYVEQLRVILEKLLTEIYPFESSSMSLNVIKTSNNVIFRNVKAQNVNLNNCEFEYFGEIKWEGKEDRLKDFTCCERKLLAKFDNSITKLNNFDFLICRYKPCEKCYWIVQHLTNFYVVDGDEAYKMIIPSNICITSKSISLPDLSKNELHKFSMERLKIEVWKNYLFIKEPIV